MSSSGVTRVLFYEVQIAVNAMMEGGIPQLLFVKVTLTGLKWSSHSLILIGPMRTLES